VTELKISVKENISCNQYPNKRVMDICRVETFVLEYLMRFYVRTLVAQS